MIIDGQTSVDCAQRTDARKCELAQAKDNLRVGTGFHSAQLAARFRRTAHSSSAQGSRESRRKVHHVLYGSMRFRRRRKDSALVMGASDELSEEHLSNDKTLVSERQSSFTAKGQCDLKRDEWNKFRFTICKKIKKTRLAVYQRALVKLPKPEYERFVSRTQMMHIYQVRRHS